MYYIFTILVVLLCACSSACEPTTPHAGTASEAETACRLSVEKSLVASGTPSGSIHHQYSSDSANISGAGIYHCTIVVEAPNTFGANRVQRFDVQVSGISTDSSGTMHWNIDHILPTN